MTEPMPGSGLARRLMLREIADEVVCLDIPEPFYGVGGFYYDFAQTSDAEVNALLKKSHQSKHLKGRKVQHA